MPILHVTILSFSPELSEAYKRTKPVQWTGFVVSMSCAAVSSAERQGNSWRTEAGHQMPVLARRSLRRLIFHRRSRFCLVVSCFAFIVYRLPSVSEVHAAQVDSQAEE